MRVWPACTYYEPAHTIYTEETCIERTGVFNGATQVVRRRLRQEGRIGHREAKARKGARKGRQEACQGAGKAGARCRALPQGGRGCSQTCGRGALQAGRSRERSRLSGEEAQGGRKAQGARQARDGEAAQALGAPRRRSRTFQGKDRRARSPEEERYLERGAQAPSA